MYKVLFVDDTHPILKSKLEKNNFVCEDFTGKTYEDLYNIINDYFGIIIRSKFNIDKNIIDKAINLKFIGRVGAGMESIDVEYATSNKILCINSPEGSRNAVGEHTIALILNLFNNISTANSEVKSGQWNREKNRGNELSGKTVGIIGYGNMGSSTAKKLSGFDCTVISYDKYKKKYSDGYTKEVSMEDIFKYSDVLSLHIPLTNETKGIVNTEFINNFKKPFFLINTSRGPIVNTHSLVYGIKNDKILGAGLDVLEYEKTSFEKIDFKNNFDFNFLINSKKVILTPHVAGWTHESKISLAEVLADKIIKVFKTI